jgi:hypothetical protein
VTHFFSTPLFLSARLGKAIRLAHHMEENGFDLALCFLQLPRTLRKRHRLVTFEQIEGLLAGLALLAPGDVAGAAPHFRVL